MPGLQSTQGPRRVPAILRIGDAPRQRLNRAPHFKPRSHAGHWRTGSPRRTANRRYGTPPRRYGAIVSTYVEWMMLPSREHPYASGAVEGHRGRHGIGRVKKENSASPWTRRRRSPLGVPDRTSRPLRSAPRDAPDGGPFGRDWRDGRREQRRRIRARPLTRAFTPWTVRTRAHLPK